MREKVFTYVRGWSWMRGLRLVLGIIILVQGFVAGETVTAMLGAVFAGMALTNVGCNGGCSVG